MTESPCPLCRSPRTVDWNERDQRIVASPVSRPVAESAIAYLRRVDIGYGDDAPLLGEGVLETVLADADAVRVRETLQRVIDEANRCLDAVPQSCPECGAPSEEVFAADREPRGRLWRAPADDGFREALKAAYELHLETRPAAFSADNPYYEEGDEQAPFISEACLYVLLGKDPARSVLSAMRQLTVSMGERSRR